MNNVEPQTINNKNWIILFSGIFLIQFFMSAYTFPISQLFSDTLHTFIDHPMHWYRIVVANTLANSGNVSGFDPYFAAGSPAGVMLNPAAKLPSLVSVIVGDAINPIVIWKLYVFCAAVFAPLCLAISCRILKLPIGVAIIASTLGLLLWWTSMFRWFHTAGLVSYVLAMYFTLPYMALVLSYLSGNGGIKTLLFIGAFGALFVLIHPLFGIPVTVFIFIALAFLGRENNVNRILLLFTISPLVTLIPNLIWIIPTFFEHIYFYDSTSISEHQTIVDINMIWKEFVGIWEDDFHGSRMYALLFFCSLLTFVSQASEKQKLYSIVLVITGIFFILYAAFGSLVPLFANLTQPNRFAVTGYLLLCIPGAIGIYYLVTKFKQNLIFDYRALNYVSAGVISVLVLVNLNELGREISYAPIGHYGKAPPEVVGPGQYSESVLEFLDRNTNENARVLFETANGRIHDKGHMAAYYAYVSKREFIGGPYPYLDFANFTDGVLFNEDIQDFTPLEIMQYIDLYNIGWVIAHSPESKKTFDSMKELKHISAFKELNMYEVNRDHSYFIKGTGVVAERNINKIVLKELSGNSVVIKYHYLKGLKSTPAHDLKYEHFLDDPNGFIRIDNPPEKLTLFLP